MVHQRRACRLHPCVVVRMRRLGQARKGAHRELSRRCQHFGLGEASRADALDVRWPDGRTTRIAHPLAQPLLIIDDPDRVYADGAESPGL